MRRTRIHSKSRFKTSAILVYPEQRIRRGKELDIITCEYPPDLGGVADYTYKVAEGLQKLGIKTHIWSPGHETVNSESADAVTRSLGRFGLRHLLLSDRLMGKAGGKCLLLQWKPVGYGLKSLNLPFCLWIASRVLRGSRLVVMFHETFLPLENASLKRRAASILQRIMAFTLTNCAEAVFVSHGNGATALHKLSFKEGKVQHLPVFSNVDSEITHKSAASTRALFAAEDEILLGHFGRYMARNEPLVLPPLAEVLQRNSRLKILFIGECGARYRSALLQIAPQFESRVMDAGVRSSKEIGTLISACDFMFQPYPDGITTRRSSAMAALANGKPVLSNDGPETENLWRTCGGIHLLDMLNPAVIAEQLNKFAENPDKIRSSCQLAAAFYKTNFSVDRTVEAIVNCSPLADDLDYRAVELA